MIYHITLSQGRSDTIYLESSSKSKILTLLNTISTAVVRNIKELVYSKDYNINYVSKPFEPSPTYHKVIIFALTENYADTITLYNVKKTVTKELLQKQFKKLMINNEPIIDFFDIQFYNEGVSPTSYDNLFQVQYKRNSKTYVEKFYSDSWLKVKDVAESIIDGEITEIRKFVHYDSTVRKDDVKDYHKSVYCNITNNEAYSKFSLPKVKKSVDYKQLISLLKLNLKFKGKSITNEEIKLSYR